MKNEEKSLETVSIQSKEKTQARKVSDTKIHQIPVKRWLVDCEKITSNDSKQQEWFHPVDSPKKKHTLGVLYVSLYKTLDTQEI